MSNVLQTLKRDLQANPAKGIVLGVACLVFAWFWMPILTGWLQPVVQQASVVALPTVVTPMGTKSQAAISVENTTHATWYDSRIARADDPRRQSILFPADQREPFALVEPVAVSEIVTTQAPVQQDASPEPEIVREAATLGLKVESIIYGSARRMARINGQVYREQESIPLAVDNAESKQGDTAKLLKISPNAVSVEVDQHRYEIPLKVNPLLRSGQVSLHKQ